MSDIAQVREASIFAETKVEAVFTRALDRLHELNTRLAELHDEIKQAQPVATGAVCLELYPCGPGCMGCPHPRWVKYAWTQGTAQKQGVMLSVNLDAQKRDPILTLGRKAPHYTETAKLIREAKSILKERTDILDSARGVRYAVKNK